MHSDARSRGPIGTLALAIVSCRSSMTMAVSYAPDSTTIPSASSLLDPRARPAVRSGCG